MDGQLPPHFGHQTGSNDLLIPDVSVYSFWKCEAAIRAQMRDNQVFPSGGDGRRTFPAITKPVEPYSFRVGDDRGRTVTPKCPHLRLVVQIGAGDDRAGGLDELPMPEYIDQRGGRERGQARQGRLDTPEEAGKALRSFPVAPSRVSGRPIALDMGPPIGGGRAGPARRV